MMKKILRLVSAQIFILFLALFLIILPQSAKAQFNTELGAVSGTISWGAENTSVANLYRVTFTGNTTGFTTRLNNTGTSYNTGFSLPADTYTVTVSILNSNSTAPYDVATQTVTVVATQTTTANFDLSATTALVKGSLKINGVTSSGVIQFCDPAPASCPTPISNQVPRYFTFNSNGFSVPLLPGEYRAHVTTNQGVDVGIVPITVSAGQIVTDASLQFQLDLGSVSGSVSWPNESTTVGNILRLTFVGNTTGFTQNVFPISGNFNTGSSLPPDTYTVTLAVLNSNSTAPYTVATQTVTVSSGQSSILNFDLSATTALVKGGLKINGVASSGVVQFCDPAPASCPTPISNQVPRYFTFNSNGFSVPLLPGDYRVHVTTNQGIDVGIVPITVSAGQVVNDASLQFQLDLGSVSGIISWGTDTTSVTNLYRVTLTGNTNGFTTRVNNTGVNYNTGFSLPADTYTVTLSILNSNSTAPYDVATQTVTVSSGQTANANFDMSSSTGLVKGGLKINGVASPGVVQFCDPAPASCPTPISNQVPRYFTFNTGGFSVPLLPGAYRVHVTTNQGVDVCTTSVTVVNGQVITLASCSNEPTTTIDLATQNPDTTYTDPTIVTLSATASGGHTIANTFYKIDNGAQQTYTSPFTVSGSGDHGIEYWSVDNAGVEETHKTKAFTIYVNQSPVVDPFSGGTIDRGQTFTAISSFTDADSTSWTATVDYGDIGGGEESLTLNPDKTFSLSHQYNTAGEYEITVVVRDNHQSTGSTQATVTVVVPDPVTTTFTSSADSYVRSGGPNRNLGAGVFMRLQSSGDNRSLVRFDQSAMQSQIGTKEVLSAKLRVTIADGGTGWGSAGRTIDAHRLLANWTEGNGTENNQGAGSGLTWNCATDSNIDNSTKNCSGTTEWEMGQPNNPSVHPWAQTASATQTITNNQSGVVEFDVTADVANFLNGTNQNYGWLIKKTDEGQSGNVSFGTKESSTVPQLVVTYQP